MNLFYQPDIDNGVHFLDNEESRHAVKVLRYKNGDKLNIVNGKGTFFNGEITDANSKKCHFKIIDQKASPKQNYNIHIAIAPTKNIERIEWFVEKAIEIGIHEISLIICDNSERKVVKTERLMRKAVSAMKQSIKAHLPTINTPIHFNKFIQTNIIGEKYIANVDFDNPTSLYSSASKNSNYCILIGPEGDFSEKELEMALNHDFKKVSLGNSRLRTETAGISACHILNLINP
ncbi:MAG: 16S rRNA (uracil(1498)-N(3))-methyltransferase [Cyclobacteriaceae bacterium]|nr:16S rRNA (uracil(1498)-N(3))-methyltransferase [Cyclobacteriaceae bacterium]